MKREKEKREIEVKNKIRKDNERKKRDKNKIGKDNERKKYRKRKKNRKCEKKLNYHKNKKKIFSRLFFCILYVLSILCKCWFLNSHIDRKNGHLYFLSFLGVENTNGIYLILSK